MKKHFRMPVRATIIIILISFFLSNNASATRIYVSKYPDNGVYYNGGYIPGDTIVLKASLSPFSYFVLENVHGTAQSPIVVINEGGQVRLQTMDLKHCTFIKISGKGSADQYGFFITNPTQNPVGPGIHIHGRSSDIEVNNCDLFEIGYGFWIKEEGTCDVSLQHPNWRLNNISIHDNRMQHMRQEGIYAGSTAPNGERPVTCNGVLTNPLPMRLGNIKIYNNIIFHTNRGGIQLSNADYGNNEIYGNTVTHSGYEMVPAQGNGIILGGYTTAYVHHNTVDYTFSTGIFSLGAGLVRIEDNRVDHSGQLNGIIATASASIMVDTRLTIPVTPTNFIVKNNILGANTDYHVRVYDTYPTYSTTGNMICHNTTIAGTNASILVQGTTSWSNCNAVNMLPVPNAGPAQVITLPVSQATLSGSATDADGTIAGYSWSQVSGPSTANINYRFSAVALAYALIQGTYVFRLTATDNLGATATSDITVTVNGTTGTTPSSSRIEAENYVSMNGIQTENTVDANGGKNVGWQDNNDWMDYQVTVAATGFYNVNFRVASMFTGAQFQLRKADGTALATITVPNTGNFQSWQTITAGVNLTAGTQTLRIFTTSANGGWNINWFEMAAGTTPPPPPPSNSNVKIQAENYSAMFGIQTENTNDAGGGLNVGWQDNNDWLDYAVNLSTAGTYTVSFRVASMFTGAQFQLRKSDGTVLSTVTVPNTGNFQSWQTVTASVTLPAGQQTLRIVTTQANGGWNFNWWELVATVTPPPPASQKIEAENYTAMSGIQTENTNDAGGGLNVAWQDNNDWMNYSVNITNAGTYTVNFRVASMFTGAQFQLRKADGTTLATVTVPNTGNFQNWQTVSASVNFPAGQQTLQIVTTQANGGWNFNWWEVTGTSGTRIAAVIPEAENDIAVSVYPNPVKEKLMLRVNNKFTGIMKVQIISMSGAILKTIALTKQNSGSMQAYLAIGEMKPGIYIIRVICNDEVYGIKINKL